MAELILKAMVELEIKAWVGRRFSLTVVPSVAIRNRILTNSVCLLLHHVGFNELRQFF